MLKIDPQHNTFCVYNTMKSPCKCTLIPQWGKPFKYCLCIKIQNKDRRKMFLRKHNSIEQTSCQTCFLSSTEDKQRMGRRLLTHPVFWCLWHLTQLALEVNIYGEIQISLQATTEKMCHTERKIHNLKNLLGHCLHCSWHLASCWLCRKSPRLFSQ